MNCPDIIEELKAQTSEKYKANVVKLGIPEECSLGVSTAIIRKLAKRIGKSKELAFELWNTGYHEARLLSVLLLNHQEIKKEEIESLMSGVQSWDLCDHLCKNLIVKHKDRDVFISEWMTSPQVYKRRGAFTLIAAALTHDRKLTDDTISYYLKLIEEYSDQPHEQVKKAVSWALREIGKKDFQYNEKALLLAHDMEEKGSRVQKQIARDVIRELENLVKTQGRARLISSETRMGKQELEKLKAAQQS